MPRLLAAAFAVAAGVVLAPGRASAACGEYVRVGGDHRAADPAPGDAPARKPCDGPGCSGHPAAPVPLTAPAGGPAHGPEWAATTPAEAAPADGRGRLVPPPAAAVSVHLPRPVFHPPRAG